MKKTIFILSALAIFSCKKEPKDYVTLSGKITDKISDSLVIRTRDYSKTIKVNPDGTFKDTLKVEPGVFNLFDGSESTYVFLKNGYDINLTLDTKIFDESIKYTGIGSENNNYLAEKSIIEEKLLNPDKLASLDLAGLDSELESIKKQLNEFYNSKQEIDTFLTNSANKNLEPMLNMYENYFKASIELKEQLAKGNASPAFENYENYNGGQTSLKDLAGKYVYVDVWATWCGPCKAEIPALKALDKAYQGKNIQFVSISIDDDRSHGGSWEKAKADWKAMVADEELGGMQLFAPNGWQSQFVLDYKINGIPRFLLIDPNGNIVNPDAPRPSSSGLIDLFNSLNI
tara:strand:- start:29 stop:1060 length:1032 start_codon:yes stop_codon:yes gene_type:complete